jgi:hypothetical protein
MNVSPPFSGQTAVCWFLDLGFFYPENGGDTFIRKVGSHKITRRHIPEDGILRIWYVAEFEVFIISSALLRV